MSREVVAAVVTEPGRPPELQKVRIDDPREGEVLIRLGATGICATDLHFSHMMSKPAVLGHEGAGWVEECGPGVTRFAPGDAVIATFARCGTCANCRAGEPAYCTRFDDLNFGGTRENGSSAVEFDGDAAYAHFLGQSSFATHMVVRESSLVDLPPGADPRAVAPYGCGLMTGAGAVLNVLRPGPTDTVAVFGAGTVGLAAVMAAAAAGARAVIAVDLSPERLALASAVGATHVVEAGGGDVVSAIDEIVPGGVDFAVESTGVGSVLTAAVEALSRRGTCAVVGIGSESTISLDWRTLLNGRTVTGVISGSSLPEVAVPDLLNLADAGRFPAEKLVRNYAFTDIAEAWEAARSGGVVKAVLQF
ncbi:aryl-alcohol dehydrogenase [Rhodococcus rhodochrous]|uniref:NAD(P)-dependent alcohol dehydrogenase n=1 Tax=Rhodococcus rhodochrous TaxID=1829 RepID=UPI0007CD91FD|nr:NAD(P)-dependent alcohol dehydrogenase [Rhodococcus rhodochrous]MDO1485119.1 NAD(P)-dependent alcohol dehydrogenase [Rhodococcus rhodochrous]SNV09971.1 aryl-alcohol dehydrogenase [Rhodococcus rhodochrous]